MRTRIERGRIGGRPRLANRPRFPQRRQLAVVQPQLFAQDLVRVLAEQGRRLHRHRGVGKPCRRAHQGDASFGGVVDVLDEVARLESYVTLD